MAFLLSLPSEIIIEEILRRLRHRDLARCIRVCRTLYVLITNADTLQYNAHLDAANLVENPRTAISFPERLSMVREYHRRLQEVSTTSSMKYFQTNKYTLQCNNPIIRYIPRPLLTAFDGGGIVSVSGPHTVELFRLGHSPTQTKAVSLAPFSKLGFDSHLICAVGTAIGEQDLFAVVTCERQLSTTAAQDGSQTIRARSWYLHVLRFSSAKFDRRQASIGGPHQIKSIDISCIFTHVAIYGKYVVLTERRLAVGTRSVIVHWEARVRLHCQSDTTWAGPPAFLRQDIFVVPGIGISSQCRCLLVYYIPKTVEGEVLQAYLIQQLNFPVFTNHYQFITEFATSKRGETLDPLCAFFPDPKMSFFTIQLDSRAEDNLQAPVVHRYVGYLTRRDLLSAIVGSTDLDELEFATPPNSQLLTVKSWLEWGTHSSWRLMDPTRPEATVGLMPGCATMKLSIDGNQNPYYLSATFLSDALTTYDFLKGKGEERAAKTQTYRVHAVSDGVEDFYFQQLESSLPRSIQFFDVRYGEGWESDGETNSDTSGSSTSRTSVIPQCGEVVNITRLRDRFRRQRAVIFMDGLNLVIISFHENFKIVIETFRLGEMPLNESEERRVRLRKREIAKMRARERAGSREPKASSMKKKTRKRKRSLSGSNSSHPECSHGA